MVTCFVIVTTAQLLPLLCNMHLQHGIILFGERTQNTVFDSLMGKDKIISATPISVRYERTMANNGLGISKRKSHGSPITIDRLSFFSPNPYIVSFPHLFRLVHLRGQITKGTHSKRSIFVADLLMVFTTYAITR